MKPDTPIAADKFFNVCTSFTYSWETLGRFASRCGIPWLNLDVRKWLAISNHPDSNPEDAKQSTTSLRFFFSDCTLRTTQAMRSESSNGAPVILHAHIEAVYSWVLLFQEAIYPKISHLQKNARVNWLNNNVHNIPRSQFDKLMSNMRGMSVDKDKCMVLKRSTTHWEPDTSVV